MEVHFNEKYGFMIASDEHGNEVNWCPNVLTVLCVKYNGKLYEKEGCHWKGCGRGTRVTKAFTEWADAFIKFSYDEYHLNYK